MQGKADIVALLKSAGDVPVVVFTVEPLAAAPAGGAHMMRSHMVVPFFSAMEGVSQHSGVLQAGETVRVLQVVADSKGKMKVQHEKGWTPLRAPNGDEVFEDLGGGGGGGGGNTLGAVPAAPAPMPTGMGGAKAGAASMQVMGEAGGAELGGAAAVPVIPDDPEVAAVKEAIAVFNERAKHGVRKMLDDGLARIDSLRERGVVSVADVAKFASERGQDMTDDSPAAVCHLLRRVWGKGWDLKPSHSQPVSEDGAVVLCYLSASGQERPCLAKQEVGEYLGEPDEFNMGVMAEWLRLDNYNGLGFDDALRMFLAGFKLPGEAQKVDRFMEAFSAEYFRANPGVFVEQDTAYTLAFSVIMLNTDHFNPSIREDRKMTRTQFIGNNRAIDTALTPQFLGAMFDRICSNEIKMDSIDTDDQSSIICYTNPLKHGYLEKKGPGGLGKGAYKKRWFVLKNKLLYYLEEPPALGKRPQLRGFIPIDSIVVDDDEDDLPDPPKGGAEDCAFIT